MYITYKTQNLQKTQQLDLYEAILKGIPFEMPTDKQSYPSYITVSTEKLVHTPFNEQQASTLKVLLYGLAEKIKPLISEIDSHYYSFKIPKHNGKFRQIDAPDDTLKLVLTQVKNVLQYNCHIHPHNAAFAYVPQRSNKHAVEKHQKNQSKWFLHIDLKDFFSSCDEAFIHNQLKQIYPFNTMYTNNADITVMQIIVQGALYKNRLPQGTPLSPYLTNIIMVPIDYALHNLCKQWNKQHFVYTRYADDIDISSKYEFDYKALLAEINRILGTQSPLKINYDKVRYGSVNYKNWHLGLMLNQHNQITVGTKKKKLIKAKLHNFCTNKENWSTEDAQTFLSELAYFRNIEPEYHDFLIAEYTTKHNNNLDIIRELQNMLKL